MPTPVAALLNRPVITLSLVLSGANGSSVLPSSIASPEPLAHQWLALMPQAMNSAAKRLGHGLALPSIVASAPQTGIDSSQGSARATPAPRRMVRRESWLALLASGVGIFLWQAGSLPHGSFRHKLRAGHNAFDQNAEAVVAGGQL